MSMTHLPNDAELAKIRSILIDEIFRNEDVMYSDFVQSEKTPDIISMLASLYNMLYLALTNTRYDYFFHHANKIGMWCNDEFFNEVIDTETKT